MSMQKQYAMATKSRQYQPHGRTLQQMVAMLAWAAAANKVRVVISLQYDDDDDVSLQYVVGEFLVIGVGCSQFSKHC